MTPPSNPNDPDEFQDAVEDGVQRLARLMRSGPLGAALAAMVLHNRTHAYIAEILNNNYGHPLLSTLPRRNDPLSS